MQATYTTLVRMFFLEQVLHICQLGIMAFCAMHTISIQQLGDTQCNGLGMLFLIIDKFWIAL